MLQQIEQVGICDRCNYPLRGLNSNRCPECGHPFDPNDPKTMNMGLPMGRIAKALITTVKRRTALTFLICFMLLWGSAWLAFSFYVFTFGLALMIGLILYQYARVIIRWWVAKWYRRPIDRHPRPFFWPLFLTLALASTGLPRLMMLTLQRPLLDRYARYVYEDIPYQEFPSEQKWIGLYYFASVHVSVSGLVSLQCGPGYGIFYIDPGNPYEFKLDSGRWAHEVWYDKEDSRWYANSLFRY